MTDPPKVRHLSRSFQRHRAHVLGLAIVVAGFCAFGIATGSNVAIAYPIMVVLGGLLVARLEPADGFSGTALTGLTMWAIGHLAGGIVGLDGDRVLYNALIPPGIHYDNIVHFIGFGSAGLIWWEATRPWLKVEGIHAVGVGVAVWLAGMGVGALNEVIEFIATLTLPDTNVGGYHNTGRDLIANMLGAATAGTIAARRHLRTTQG